MRRRSTRGDGGDDRVHRSPGPGNLGSVAPMLQILLAEGCLCFVKLPKLVRRNVLRGRQERIPFLAFEEFHGVQKRLSGQTGDGLVIFLGCRCPDAVLYIL